MTEYRWDRDEWPALLQRILAADILVLAGPIWLGDNSSVMRQIIERLYAYSGVLNWPVLLLRQGRRLPAHRKRRRPQALHNEHPFQPPGTSATPSRRRPMPGSRWALLFGRRIPRDPRTHQPQLHLHDGSTSCMAAMLRSAGGTPARGNQRSEWDAGCRPDRDNPEHR